jgi:hypothetical protein
MVATPQASHGLRPKIEAALREEFPNAEITFEDTDFHECLVTVEIPNSESITDVDSGEDILSQAVIVRAQEIVSGICRDEANGD